MFFFNMINMRCIFSFIVIIFIQIFNGNVIIVILMIFVYDILVEMMLVGVEELIVIFSFQNGVFGMQKQ